MGKKNLKVIKTYKIAQWTIARYIKLKNELNLPKILKEAEKF